MKVLGSTMLDELVEEARRSPRRRKNLNLHLDYNEPCQRLLNALEPDSYVRPHRHLTPLKPETFVVLRGAFLLLLFNDSGDVTDKVELRACGETFGADIPGGCWHSMIALEPGSVFFETKPGPYNPIDDKDWAPWAPEEGSPAASTWLADLRCRISGAVDA